MQTQRVPPFNDRFLSQKELESLRLDVFKQMKQLRLIQRDFLKDVEKAFEFCRELIAVQIKEHF